MFVVIDLRYCAGQSWIDSDRRAHRRTDAEHAGNDDVLERADEEEGAVLGRLDLELVDVDPRRLVPVLRLDEEEDGELEAGGEDDLADDRAEDLARDEVGRRSAMMDALVRARAPHSDGDGKNDEEIDVQELQRSADSQYDDICAPESRRATRRCRRGG